MKYFFALIFLLSISSCRSQFELTKNAKELEKLIAQKDTLNLKKYIRKFDADFSSEWKLKEIERRVEIDHFKLGYNFKWIMRKSDMIIYRTYTFDIDGNFSYGSEQRKLNDKIVSRGGIELENGALKYIQLVYPKATEPKFEVGYYEFELFKNGKLIAIYRAENLNHFYLLTEEKNKDKIELVYGTDCLHVKK